VPSAASAAENMANVAMSPLSDRSSGYISANSVAVAVASPLQLHPLPTEW